MDKTIFSAISLSILCNFFIWFIFSPVIMFTSFKKIDSKMVYLGTVSVGRTVSYSSVSNSCLQHGLVVKIVKVGNLYPFVSLKSYESKLTKRLLDLFRSHFNVAPGCNVRLSLNSVSPKVKKSLNIFSKGKMCFFPNGKKYGFVPVYIYPNVYRMIMIFRCVEAGYK